MSEALSALRRALHREPELSDQESETAARITERLHGLGPDSLWTGLGGHGVAAAFASGVPGPTLLWRCELDALPICEVDDGRPHRSIRDGVAHLCGHDGHMAIALGVAERLAVERPTRGRVVLLFQPAEETGAGARRVAAERRFQEEIAPDMAFALHNLPGHPAGTVVLREGTFCCASRGLSVRLGGRTAHAAQPETGCSPAAAMCRAIALLGGLAEQPELRELGFLLATVVHARLGERAFGTMPGDAEICATLRATTNDAMDRLAARAEQAMHSLAAADGLTCETIWTDCFDATVNDVQATARIRAAAVERGAQLVELREPIRWSEDFGALAGGSPATPLAMFGLGAGDDVPPLHDQRYDFPDALLPGAIELVCGILAGDLLSEAD